MQADWRVESGRTGERQTRGLGFCGQAELVCVCGVLGCAIFDTQVVGGQQASGSRKHALR